MSQPSAVCGSCLKPDLNKLTPPLIGGIIFSKLPSLNLSFSICGMGDTNSAYLIKLS